MPVSAKRWLEVVESIVIPRTGGYRFTQDSPVYEDVWMAYAQSAADSQVDVRQELLLTVHREASPVDAVTVLRERLRNDVASRRTSIEANRDDSGGTVPGQTTFGLSISESHIAVRLTLGELVRVALPMTNWWQNYAFRVPPDRASNVSKISPDALRQKNVSDLFAPLIPCRLQLNENGEEYQGFWITPDLVWLIDVVGVIARGPKSLSPKETLVATAFRDTLAASDIDLNGSQSLIWSVSRNRAIEQSLDRSTRTAKADAAHSVFRPDCSHLSWAVVDSGVDATHTAFRKRQENGEKYDKPFVVSSGRIQNNTRVRTTYDFTRMRALIDIPVLDNETNAAGITADELQTALFSGRSVNWGALESQFRVEYVPADPNASAPKHEHGTHVAGTLAGEWAKSDRPPAPAESLNGICPTLELYDFRVFDDKGEGNEYSILAALQFIRYLNAGKDQPVIHGVNLSLSIRHDVKNFACGCTPICEECERLVGAGVVVVAAAGNLGYARFQSEQGARSDGFRVASITDPGNAELVITVGATHRTQPHRYGISYFSSRGPTGDGRLKPDLVAPGEKIVAPTPHDGSRSMDGTSMAAPHVSGAAALLMARYPELIGRPDVVKRILMKSATDLGRDHYFQGAGMLDILRALQSV